MKPLDRFFNYAVIFILTIGLIILIYFSISEYDNEKQIFEFNQRGKDGIRDASIPVEQWSDGWYYFEWFLLSLIFIVPLVISLFRLTYYYKTWLTVLYYVFVTIYCVQFIHLMIILLFRYY